MPSSKKVAVYICNSCCRVCCLFYPHCISFSLEFPFEILCHFLPCLQATMQSSKCENTNCSGRKVEGANIPFLPLGEAEPRKEKIKSRSAQK